MNNEVSVRSLLVDKPSGRIIKAIDERDLSDFLPLLTNRESKNPKIVLYDFSPVIQYFHNEIEGKLAQREHKELTIKRATVFNTWMRLKTVTNEMLLCQTSSQVMRDSEEVLNWIHTRIPELVKNYSLASRSKPQHAQKNEKTEALLKLSDDIEVFIEILLCNIHATAKVDIKSLRADFVITEHCKSIQKLVLQSLSSELDFHNGTFNSSSIIHQSCMENLGINPEALINLIGADCTKESIKNAILSKATIEDAWDGYNNERKYVVTWPKSDPDAVERVKMLSKLLERINLLLVLVENLKNSEATFEDRPEKQEEFERSIQMLLPNPQT